MARTHSVSIVVGGVQIRDWKEYRIASSMIVPADQFEMRRSFDYEIWQLLKLDSIVDVYIDNVQILRGLIDRRKLHDVEDEISIGGFDFCGRLVAESAPTISYEGLEMTEAIRRLAGGDESVPWFSRVTLSDARNRRVRTGKGGKVPTGNEPIVVKRRTPGGGRAQPGQTRWQVIEEIVSEAGLMCWSSADGRELFVGRPNYQQAPLFVITRANGKAIDYEEDIGDGYSLIAAVGAGGATLDDYGAPVASRSAIVRDVENLTGTGGDFQYPKRLLMPERNLDSDAAAREEAEREMARRNWKRRMVTATVPDHGQFVGSTAPTIYAPNTIATVVQDKIRLRRDFAIVTCTYQASRTEAETTLLELVPRGTEIVL